MSETLSQSKITKKRKTNGGILKRWEVSEEKEVLDLRGGKEGAHERVEREEREGGMI